MFRCQGAGPCDETAALAELRRTSADGQVLTVVVGRDDLVRSADPQLEAHLGLSRGSLRGQQVQVLQRHLNRYVETARSADRVDATATFGSQRFRVVIVARRDRSGWADEAVLAFAPVAD